MPPLGIRQPPAREVRMRCCRSSLWTTSWRARSPPKLWAERGAEWLREALATQRPCYGKLLASLAASAASSPKPRLLSPGPDLGPQAEEHGCHLLNTSGLFLQTFSSRPRHVLQRGRLGADSKPRLMPGSGVPGSPRSSTGSASSRASSSLALLKPARTAASLLTVTATLRI